MGYKVLVDDNFHYMDEDERYCAGEFPDAESALADCRRIVDECLESAYRPGMSAAQLWEGYVGFGEDPFIVSVGSPEVKFSAWDYARQRCALMCAPQPSASVSE